MNSPNLEEIYLEKKKEFLNKLIPAPDPALAPTSVLEQEKETQGEATPEKPRAAAAAYKLILDILQVCLISPVI